MGGPLLESDLLDVLDACVDGCLDPAAVRWQRGSAVTVVLASEGYPNAYPKGRTIHGLDAATMPGLTVFHAGTTWNAEGHLSTSGGRVLGVTALGATLDAALQRAYEAAGLIAFDGMFFRRDIGHRALASLRAAK